MTILSSVPTSDALRARRTWWPSAAACAFLASGLEIFGLVLFQLQRSRAVEVIASTPSLGVAALVTAELMLVFVVWMFLFSVAIELTALWGVGRREQVVAPVTAQLGQWTVAAYVVVSAPVFVLIVLMNVGGFGVWPTVSAHSAQFLSKDMWVFQVATLLVTGALVCLGLASRSGTGPLPRLAKDFMLLTAIFGVCNVDTTLFGLPFESHGLSLKSLDVVSVVLCAAMWAGVGRMIYAGSKLSRLSQDRVVVDGTH